jgi:hypothetical protein
LATTVNFGVLGNSPRAPTSASREGHETQFPAPPPWQNPGSAHCNCIRLAFIDRLGSVQWNRGRGLYSFVILDNRVDLGWVDNQNHWKGREFLRYIVQIPRNATVPMCVDRKRSESECAIKMEALIHTDHRNCSIELKLTKDH